LVTAASHFASAAEAFKEDAPAPPDDKKLPAVWEWVARARSEQVEMLLRAGKHQEVLAIAEKFLGQKWAQRSQYASLVRYHHGFSAFRLGALSTAKDSLEKVQLFGDLAFRVYAEHAHYLLGRAKHLSEENEGAFDAYNLVLSRYQKARVDAGAALKDPEALKKNPVERRRLESLVNSPPPEHVERARYYRGALFFEENKHEEALKAFIEFAQAHPESALLPDALLRRGMSLWNLSRYSESLEVLNPLIQGAPRLADEAYLWLGKALVSIGQSAKPEDQDKAFQGAMENFRKSIELLKPKSATDAAAKKRLSEVLIHLSDTQMLTKNYKDAGANYVEILKLGAASARTEELLYRQATALHLAGEYAESDKLCAQFIVTYPDSGLKAQILFRMAENGFFQATALEKGLPPESADRSQQIQTAYAEAGKRYQKVVDGHADFQHLNLARLGLAASLYRQQKFKEADAALAPVAPEELSGELAQGLSLRADCLLRQVPDFWDKEADRATRDTLLDEAIK
ncbi:MAG: tetratricopeptide repeat protein, partial [Planctomycetota bacterium]|nr:tetratricopeptide repeat protein [Planctomycetota bacterium]